MEGMTKMLAPMPSPIPCVGAEVSPAITQKQKEAAPQRAQ